MERLKFTVVRAKGSIVTLLVIAFLVFMSNVSEAQVAFGPKGGVAVTMLRGSDLNNIKARTSFLGGVFVNIQAAKWFTIQPEFLISQKGATYTSNG
ncbi:MAG TPA: hypothetical protein VL947_11105, partial [Cytophagales bacterium]|nr:hypothetical protein [Cytophagales bacterium]